MACTVGSIIAAAAFLLIPREELNLVGEDLYGGEPLPFGSELMRARLARSRRAHATGTAPSTILTEEESNARTMTSRGTGYGDRQARLPVDTYLRLAADCPAAALE